MSEGKKRGYDGLVVTEKKVGTKLRRPRLFKVLLHNDDFTTMEFVVAILRSVFRKSEAEATQLMLKVHNEGAAIAGLFPYEIAETKAAQVVQKASEAEYPLLCTVEPADGESDDA